MRLMFGKRTHYMYFIQVENSGPIKIGIAKDVKKRMAGLQTGCPYKLNLLYATKCCKEDETNLHGCLRENFPEFVIRGEWYMPTDPIFNTINDLKYFDNQGALLAQTI